MSRTLADAVRFRIDPRSRIRGEAYFRQGLVSTVYANQRTFSATVHGTREYDVTLTLDRTRLAVRCTCPFFIDQDVCKHIWAGILEASAQKNFVITGDLELYEDIGGDVAAEFGHRPAAPVRPAPPPPWKLFLSQVAPAGNQFVPPRALYNGELVYQFDLAQSITAGAPVIALMTRERKKSGDWAKPKPLALLQQDVPRLPDPADQRILEIVSGASQTFSYGPPVAYTGAHVPASFTLNRTLQRELIPKLCETGRLLHRTTHPGTGRSEYVPMAWEPQPAEFSLRIVDNHPNGYTVDGALRSGDRERPFADVMFMTSSLVLWKGETPKESPRFATFDTGGADVWLSRLVQMGPVTVPPEETSALVEAIATANLARVECPDDLRIDERRGSPVPILRVTRPQPGRYGGYSGRVDAALTFAYGNLEVDAWSAHAVVFDRERRLSWRRDLNAERHAIGRLQAVGVRRIADYETGGTRLDLADTQLPVIVRVLLAEGWRVEADGKLYRRAGALKFDVRSGVDWFELHGDVDFDGVSVNLPTLLAAAKRGDTFVRLGDGTFGLLPQEWLSRSGRIAALGTTEADHIRFEKPQAALLDAWLAAEPAVSYDEAFSRARAELARFEGIAPIDPPKTFRGGLRDYQREALGWFDFLRRFGFGGCLADEMGLGKTVMVLAMLEARRLERERTSAPPNPSLIVVPKSLVFNWHQEAERFAPKLRVLDYTGGGRKGNSDALSQHDVVLTTYGTLRKDVGELKELRFDYVILDEAQAIKNAATSSAKAARLLKGDHRLALSGTPVENHLGELWSLFDFLNPGLLGASAIFNRSAAAGGENDELAMLARGLRPFILRRTKEQVAAELPSRTEQTLYCDLEPAQRAMYDELRDHYRAALLGKIERGGIGRSKLQILEALLRLRQAASHPGLVDPTRADAASAKFDVLVPRLQELVEDGRKVLIFSQFTTLLGLLRQRLDEAALQYEYLDGKTRDREARVRRFQEDPATPLFLISLKAGGLGLNLTAAEYVFLLDPWWNPAVEAQAIDRAHRIGQTRPVFAFRLIARGTVEEKVLELQATKRQLADAIVRAESSLIRDLKREDLELLLS
jgi:superfamily II DNA or RNA helicase